MEYQIVNGDLLEQDVDLIVNAWNRNIIPWWLLLPQGVSGAIKRRAGLAPFRELARAGPIPLGAAVLTGPGRLPFRGIIHVAAINMFWRASERSIRRCVQSSLAVASAQGVRSVAMPIFGSGSGGYSAKAAERIIVEELETADFDGSVVIVRFEKPRGT